MGMMRIGGAGDVKSGSFFAPLRAKTHLLAAKATTSRASKRSAKTLAVNRIIGANPQKSNHSSIPL
jgi:hypothetical protein